MSSVTAAEPRINPSLNELRRRLRAVPGVVTASVEPPASHGRAEEARIVPGRLIESPLIARPVGPAAHWEGPVAFLDGVQRLDVVGYVDTMPLVCADVAAAVRERVGREARMVTSETRKIIIGRPEALERVGDALRDIGTVALQEDEPTHPLRDLELARAAVDRARSGVERMVGDAYRKQSSSWLVVDGSLAEVPGWASDARMIGVSKSHSTLPFDGADLVTYLHLPQGHRSSVFQPASRQWAPVFAWGLRLWDWAGKDLFYGLVRVEGAPSPDTLAMADRISRWILAERAPISADPRWDRLLYGVHGVEELLRARFA